MVSVCRGRINWYQFGGGGFGISSEKEENLLPVVSGKREYKEMKRRSRTGVVTDIWQKENKRNKNEYV